MRSLSAIERHNQRVLVEIKKMLLAGYVKASDFDGVVGMTEDDQMKGFAGLVTHFTGIKLDYREVAKEMLGKTETKIVKELKGRYNLPGAVPDLVKLRGDIYFQSVVTGGLQPNPFVLDVGQTIIDEQLRKPIIVSNGRSKIQNGLLCHWGISDLYDGVYTCDIIKQELPLDDRKKAFISELPQMFGVKPNKVMLWEDSQSMATFAQERGLTVVYVRHALNKDFMPKSGLVLKCRSLARTCSP